MKKKFIEDFEAQLRESDVISEADSVVIWACGSSAADEESESFIRNTNEKYFGDSEAAELLGNFAEIKINNERDFIRINLDTEYEAYKSDGWEPVILHVAENIEYASRIETHCMNVFEKLSDYEAIKDRLIIRPLNHKRNTAALEGATYKLIADVALVLYAVVFDDAENSSLNTIKIPRSVADEWPVSFDELFVSAMGSTVAFAPARIYTNMLLMDETPIEESAISSDAFIQKHFSSSTIPLLTTTRKTNGAIAIFYPDVARKVSELFNESFYIAFTSIHECMIHAASGGVSPEAIRRHVRATNRAFGDGDTLSDNVFYYNRELDSIVVVAE